MKYRKKNQSYFIAGLILIISAILLAWLRLDFIKGVTKAVAMLLGIFGLWQLAEFLFEWLNPFQKGKPPVHALAPMIQVGIGMVLFLWHDYSPWIIVAMAGFSQLILGLVGAFSTYLLFKDRAKNRWSQFVNTCIHLIFAFSSLLPSDKVDDTILRLAGYLFLLSLNYFYDAQLNVSRQLLNYQHRNIRMPLPLLVTALMPYQVLRKLNLLMSQGKNPFEDRQLNPVKAKPVNKDAVDIEVFIHTGRTGFDIIGHTDLAYKGMVYSYGNHDADSRQLKDTVGPGVMFVCPRDEYIDYLLERKVTMFAFGMQLGADEEQEFEHSLAELWPDLVPFEITSDNQKNSYIGRLVASTSAKLYKFKEGQFKTYFVLGTNCVLFADYLLWKSGIDILAFAGIMTPGTYFDYFNREYLKANSKVVSRQILNQNLLALQERIGLDGSEV